VIFKALVLQALYNLSDDQAEYQLRDRFSFMRFLGLELEDAVPDAKTLPKLIGSRGLVLELIGCLHDDESRASDQITRLQQAIDGSSDTK
jgi:hypothetical protein